MSRILRETCAEGRKDIVRGSRHAAGQRRHGHSERCNSRKLSAAAAASRNTGRTYPSRCGDAQEESILRVPCCVTAVCGVSAGSLWQVRHWRSTRVLTESILLIRITEPDTRRPPIGGSPNWACCGVQPPAPGARRRRRRRRGKTRRARGGFRGGWRCMPVAPTRWQPPGGPRSPDRPGRAAPRPRPGRLPAPPPIRRARGLARLGAGGRCQRTQPRAHCRDAGSDLEGHGPTLAAAAHGTGGSGQFKTSSWGL